MIKEITSEEFAERFPEKMIWSSWCSTVYLENGVILFDTEWNGEFYTKKKDNREVHYRPIQEPDTVDEDGEVIQWKIIGYEEH